MQDGNCPLSDRLAELRSERGHDQGHRAGNLTGLPLARTRLTLVRLEGDRLKPVAKVTSSRDGQFIFGPLEEGYYQLSGIRAGFAEGRFGQRRNGAPGSPIFVPREGVQFAELRLKRLGIITGRTLDENRGGLPGVPVSAYTTGIPRRIVGSATSDDLGVYRITGLLSGKYLVRTGAAQLEDALNLLPTFHPFASVLVRDARPVVVELDSETTDTDLQPVAGNLVSLTVGVSGCQGLAQVTLSSDTGRKQATALCGGDAVLFNALAPGEYEVVAEGEADQPQKLGTFTSLYLDIGRQAKIGLSLSPFADLRLRLTDGAGGLAIRDAGVIARRRDLAGEGPEVALTSDRAQLLPGFWQITARPPSGYYLSDLKADVPGRRLSTHEQRFESRLVRALSPLPGAGQRLTLFPAGATFRTRELGRQRGDSPHLCTCWPQLRRHAAA